MIPSKHPRFPPNAKEATSYELYCYLSDEILCGSAFGLWYDYNNRTYQRQYNLKIIGKSLSQKDLQKLLHILPFFAKIDQFTCRLAMALANEFPHLVHSIFKLEFNMKFNDVVFRVLRSSILRKTPLEDKKVDTILSTYTNLRKIELNDVEFPIPSLAHPIEGFTMYYEEENRKLLRSTAIFILKLLFTDRQIEVLERISLGKSDQEIADFCGMSKNTVKSHRNGIKERFTEELELNWSVTKIVQKLSVYLKAYTNRHTDKQ